MTCWRCFRLNYPLQPPSGSFINFRNGVLDVNTRVLLPHDPELNFMHIVNVDYDPQALPDEKLKLLLLSFVKGSLRTKVP